MKETFSSGVLIEEANDGGFGISLGSFIVEDACSVVVDFDNNSFVVDVVVNGRYSVEHDACLGCWIDFALVSMEDVVDATVAVVVVFSSTLISFDPHACSSPGEEEEEETFRTV